MSVDRYDLLALLGLALLDLGLGAIYWPLAPLATGIILLVAVGWAARREVHNGTGDKPTTGPPG